MPNWWCTCSTPHISLYLKTISKFGSWVVHVLLWVLILGKSKLFNLLHGLLTRMGSTCTTTHISSFFFHVYFIVGTWVVHVLLWIMILGQSKLQLKLFYLIYGMMDRVGSTCTTSRSFFVFKAIFTFLADYAKMMVVCMYSSEFWPMAIYINLIYGMLARMGSRCTTPHISLYLETISKF